MVGEHIRSKRVAARITGYMLSGRAGIGRSRLSEIECGHVEPSPDEQARIEAALDELIATKTKLTRVAAELGWPGGREVVP
jgi:transcriptional regulator with XRE-family HTH domain